MTAHGVCAGWRKLTVCCMPYDLVQAISGEVRQRIEMYTTVRRSVLDSAGLVKAANQAERSGAELVSTRGSGAGGWCVAVAAQRTD